MVKPSAHASHILVKSKGEATQLSSNIKKLKDFQKIARKNQTAHQSKKAGILVGLGKDKWLENLKKQSGQLHSKQSQTL